MIQINLIPDVKHEYLRARRTRDVAISVSILVSIAAAGLVGVMLFVLGAQATYEAYADSKIQSEYEALSSVEGLNDMVTIDNQLSLISGQHESKSMQSRVFSILQAINPSQPNDVRFSDVSIDPAESKIFLEGTAEGGFPAVEALVKTIDNTVVISQDEDSEPTEVPLSTETVAGESSFGRDSDDRQVIRFEITVTYTPDILTNKFKSIRVQSPTKRIDVTDSKQRVPDSLFTAPAADIEEGED